MRLVARPRGNLRPAERACAAMAACPSSLYAHGSTSSARCEVAQIRWRLILPGRRENAVTADRVNLLAQRHVLIIVSTKVLDPFDVAVAAIAAHHGPRTGERIVGGRDLVVEEIGSALVEIDVLLDDGLGSLV